MTAPLKEKDLVLYRLYNSVDRKSYGPVETGKIVGIYRTWSPLAHCFQKLFMVSNTVTGFVITLHRREIVRKAR